MRFWLKVKRRWARFRIWLCRHCPLAAEEKAMRVATIAPLSLDIPAAFVPAPTTRNEWSARPHPVPGRRDKYFFVRGPGGFHRMVHFPPEEIAGLDDAGLAARAVAKAGKA